jgi:signal transduction histidine kinase/ligand-binding sensor domain-containing protein
MLHAAITRTKSWIGRCFFLLLTCLFASLQLAALNPHTLLSQYGHTAWRAQDGFVSNPHRITQTTDGCIWIAAEDRLYRFDGVKFREWIPPNHQSLPGHYVNGIVGARDGSLWIGTSAGLARWKDGRLTNYTTTKKSPGPGIDSVIEDHAGNIWVTRFDLNDGMGPLCRVKESTLECYGEKDGNLAQYAEELNEDSKGDIWFADVMLWRWHQGSVHAYFNELAENTIGVGAERVVGAPSGEIWAGFDGTGPKSGCQHFLNGKWSSYIVPGFDGRTFRAPVLFVDRNQTLWIGTQTNGLYHVRDGVADHYGTAGGLSNDHVDAIFEDTEGNLWVGTEGGIDLFRDNAVIDFSRTQGIIGPHVQALLTVSGDAVWVANDGGLNVIQAEPSPSVRRQAVPGHDVESMFQDSRGRIWLGVDGRVFSFENGKYVELKRVDGNALGPVGDARGFAEDGEGNLWALISSQRGRGSAEVLLIRDQLVRQDFRVEPGAIFLAVDRKAGIWTLSLYGLLTHYIGGTAQASFKVGDSSFSLEVDSDNTLWAATSRGLYRQSGDNSTLMGPKNGLPCSAIYSFLQDDRGAHWLRTECGILRITADQWERWLKFPEAKISFATFDVLDGARSDFANAAQRTATRSRDGRLWFVTQTSVQMVNPNRPTNTLPPPVHIEEVIADHKTYESLDKVDVPHLRGELEIDYTALSFKIPQRVLFRYKLEGHDTEWNEVGTRRQAFYTDLPPGKYRFHVIACNNDGVWNETGAALDFTILPAYYQTTWFRTLCGAVFLLLLWCIYQLRVRQLEHQFNIGLEAQVNERTRIARELHDTLLQSFQGAVFQFQAARKLLLRKADNAMQVVDDAIQAAEDGIAEGRVAIHDLRPEPAAQGNLSQLIEAAGQELVETQQSGGQPSGFRVLVEGKERTLSPLLQDEAYRILREVLRNAFAHAAAGHIEAEIRYDDDQLRLRVRDDGKGIDPKILEAGGPSGHFGIPGMRERAKRIGARLDFWSEMGAGTEVELTIPASIAYEKSRNEHRFRLFQRAGKDEQRS